MTCSLGYWALIGGIAGAMISLFITVRVGLSTNLFIAAFEINAPWCFGMILGVLIDYYFTSWGNDKTW